MDYILGGYTSRLHVMYVGVNNPFRGYVREAYENFMIGSPEKRNVRRDGRYPFVDTYWMGISEGRNHDKDME